MEDAHQQVHWDHSAERRRARDRTQRVQRAAAKDARQERHHRKGRRGREIEPIGRPMRGGIPAARAAAGSA
jgi:hypothetical protein